MGALQNKWLYAYFVRKLNESYFVGVGIADVGMDGVGWLNFKTSLN